MSPLKPLAVVAALVFTTTQATSHAEARGLRWGLGIGLPVAAALAAASIHEQRRAEEMRRRSAMIAEVRRVERARQAQAAAIRASARAAAQAEAIQLETARRKRASQIAEAARQGVPDVPVANIPLTTSAPILTSTPAPVTEAPQPKQAAVSPSAPAVPVQKTVVEMCRRFLPAVGVTIDIPCGE